MSEATDKLQQLVDIGQVALRGVNVDMLVLQVQRGEMAGMLLESMEAIEDLAQAIRLTVEYVGNDMLPAIEGWSWYDALMKHRPDLAEGFVANPLHFHAPESSEAEDLGDVLPGCSGTETCLAPAHQHGCFADTMGHCNEPEEHLPDAKLEWEYFNSLRGTWSRATSSEFAFSSAGHFGHKRVRFRQVPAATRWRTAVGADAYDELDESIIRALRGSE